MTKNKLIAELKTYIMAFEYTCSAADEEYLVINGGAIDAELDSLRPFCRRLQILTGVLK